MAGRPKMPMYEYAPDGKFIQKYETQSDVFAKYYEGKKRPLIREGKEYGILPNGNFICEKQVGRDRLEKLMRIENSKYVSQDNEKKRPVAVFNLAGEKIATFRSLHMAHVLTGIPRGTIHASANANPVRTRKYATKSSELIFRYDDTLVPL